jgi:hypothetical protein
LIQKAPERGLPFDTVLFDGWYLAPDLVEAIEAQYKDWFSILKKNKGCLWVLCQLETYVPGE